jgi:Ca2+-binding RTX toxin-like protein
VQVGTGTPTTLTIAYNLPTTNDLYLGSYGGFYANFSGELEEVKTYDRALTALEVSGAGLGAVTSEVDVSLQLGTASGLQGGIVNIQNVIGGSGNNILVGNGNNVLIGGSGDNLLIAGGAPSTLIGGSGQDVLIGGYTDYDVNQAALEAILSSWTSAPDYNTAVNTLTDPDNPILNPAAVHSNGGPNTLLGGAGLDLFFAGVNAVTDQTNGEVLFTIT